jgi:pyridoxine 4-dehydrogenase
MVAHIGLGAMRLAGPNVFGPPANRADAIALLRAAVDGGVDHIDTAQYYGQDIVNELIREALHPYPPELALVSKVGAVGTAGAAFWSPTNRRSCVAASKTISGRSESTSSPSSTSG